MNRKRDILSNVLVTGGSGFVGGNLIRHLIEHGDGRVVSFDVRPAPEFMVRLANQNPGRLEIVVEDVSNSAELCRQMSGATLVVHLAANSSTRNGRHDPSVDIEHGFQLTYSVLEAMRATDTSALIFSSSSAVYGDHGMSALIEHETELNPKSIYGAAKVAGEALIHSYASLFGINYLIARFGNPIGKGMVRGLLHDLKRNMEGGGIEIPVLGNGLQARTYIRVSRLIKVLLGVAEQTVACSTNETVNLSGRGLVTVREVIEIGSAILRTPFSPSYQSTDHGWPGDVPVVNLCLQKIESKYALELPESRSEVEAVLRRLLARDQP